jgi:hypothetical protein
MQDEFGYVPTESLPVIAEALNISNAEVSWRRHLLPRLSQGTPPAGMC